MTVNLTLHIALPAVRINLQRVFFRSARVEYFSNECFISESDHHMYEHTRTHCQTQAHGNEIKWETEGLAEAMDTHTLT